MENLTNLEIAVLEAIVNNEYQNDPGTENTINYWIWYINHGDVKGSMTERQVSGVVSSLSKKGLVYTQIEKRQKDNTICINAKGWAALQEAKKTLK